MSYPEHPDTLIVQNEFYTNGLKEIDIWNYYQKNKNQILKEVIGREVMVFFAHDLNKTVVIRKTTDETPIRLNFRNYDSVISGRTLSLHSILNKIEKFAIIDLDIEHFDVAKDAAINVYNVVKNAPFLNNVSVRFTGKSSFHIICYLRRPTYIDSAKIMLKQYLMESKLTDNYTIEHKRRPGIVNIDLSSNKIRGGFITLNSLSVTGLRCMEIPIKKIRSFKKEDAKI